MMMMMMMVVVVVVMMMMMTLAQKWKDVNLSSSQHVVKHIGFGQMLVHLGEFRVACHARGFSSNLFLGSTLDYFHVGLLICRLL